MSKLFDLKVDVVSKKNGETFLASKSIPNMPPTLCGSITPPPSYNCTYHGNRFKPCNKTTKKTNVM